ncbi:hypothetical protein MF4836_15655 [Pseudomonas sp. MF4836]|nr:hypothetical protein MF4836_15655 [Pseudomonas sp. MF4836]
MVRPSGSKAGHLTCICRWLGAPHDFDMQSSGGIGICPGSGRIAGYLMSLLAALRSQTEQVADGRRLMIETSVLR